MKKKIIQLIPLVLFVALCAALSIAALPYVKKLTEPENQAVIAAFVKGLGIWGPLIVVFAQFVQVVIAFLPGEPFEIIAGVMYGPLWGLLLCLAGAACASSLIFLLSKKFGRKILYIFFKEEQVNEWKWLKDSSKTDAVVFILFLIPGTPKDMLTYIIGVSKMSLAKFILLSSVARIPSVISSTYMGSALREGNILASVILFLVIGAMGLFGIFFKDKIVSKVKKN